MVAGGLGTCAETLGGGCAVAFVGAGNVVLGASDGIEGIQQIGYALSSAGNKITNGNAITEFRRIRSGQKPASIAGIVAFKAGK